MSVRLSHLSGAVSSRSHGFAPAATYRIVNNFRRRQVQFAIIDGTVEISISENSSEFTPIQQDLIRGHGALANPG
jgi:hypothetical protein